MANKRYKRGELSDPHKWGGRIVLPVLVKLPKPSHSSCPCHHHPIGLDLVGLHQHRIGNYVLTTTWEGAARHPNPIGATRFGLYPSLFVEPIHQLIWTVNHTFTPTLRCQSSLPSQLWVIYHPFYLPTILDHFSLPFSRRGYVWVDFIFRIFLEAHWFIVFLDIDWFKGILLPFSRSFERLVL